MGRPLIGQDFGVSLLRLWQLSIKLILRKYINLTIR
jgi:hypothetical protein